MNQISLASIESAAKTFAQARFELVDLVSNLNTEIDAIKRRHLPAIKRHVAKTADAQSALRTQIAEAPDLFIRPRTVVFHGIKLGYQKGKGTITFEDAEKVVALIRKHFPAQSDLLIITKQSPNKPALAELAVSDLKRLGCEIAQAGDQIIIHPADSDVDKIVTALLKDATTDEPLP